MQTAHKDIPRRVRKAIIAEIKARRFVVMLRTPPRPAAAITAACSSASALGLGTLCNAWSQEPGCPHFPALMFCSTPGCCVLLPEHWWAFTSPRAVELQLLGKINVSNFGAPGQSGCALLGISPSGSVSPPPGRSQAWGWAPSSAGGGLQSSAEDEAGHRPPSPSCCRSWQSDSRPAALLQPGSPGTNPTWSRASPPPGAGINDAPTALPAQQKRAGFAKCTKVQEAHDNCVPQHCRRDLVQSSPGQCMAASTAGNS